MLFAGEELAEKLINEILNKIVLTSKYHKIYNFFNFKTILQVFLYLYVNHSIFNGLCILSTAVFVKCV